MCKFLDMPESLKAKLVIKMPRKSQINHNQTKSLKEKNENLQVLVQFLLVLKGDVPGIVLKADMPGFSKLKALLVK